MSDRNRDLVTWDQVDSTLDSPANGSQPSELLTWDDVDPTPRQELTPRLQRLAPELRPDVDDVSIFEDPELSEAAQRSPTLQDILFNPARTPHPYSHERYSRLRRENPAPTEFGDPLVVQQDLERFLGVTLDEFHNRLLPQEDPAAVLNWVLAEAFNDNPHGTQFLINDPNGESLMFMPELANYLENLDHYLSEGRTVEVADNLFSIYGQLAPENPEWGKRFEQFVQQVYPRFESEIHQEAMTALLSRLTGRQRNQLIELAYHLLNERPEMYKTAEGRDEFFNWLHNEVDKREPEGRGFFGKVQIGADWLYNEFRERVIYPGADLLTTGTLPWAEEGRWNNPDILGNRQSLTLGQNFALLIGVDPSEQHFNTVSGWTDGLGIFVTDPLNYITGIAGGALQARKIPRALSRLRYLTNAGIRAGDVNLGRIPLLTRSWTERFTYLLLSKNIDEFIDGAYFAKRAEMLASATDAASILQAFPAFRRAQPLVDVLVEIKDPEQVKTVVRLALSQGHDDTLGATREAVRVSIEQEMDAIRYQEGVYVGMLQTGATTENLAGFEALFNTNVPRMLFDGDGKWGSAKIIPTDHTVEPGNRIGHILKDATINTWDDIEERVVTFFAGQRRGKKKMERVRKLIDEGDEVGRTHLNEFLTQNNIDVLLIGDQRMFVSQAGSRRIIVTRGSNATAVVHHLEERIRDAERNWRHLRKLRDDLADSDEAVTATKGTPDPDAVDQTIRLNDPDSAVFFDGVVARAPRRRPKPPPEEPPPPEVPPGPAGPAGPERPTGPEGPTPAAVDETVETATEAAEEAIVTSGHAEGLLDLIRSDKPLAEMTLEEKIAHYENAGDVLATEQRRLTEALKDGKIAPDDFDTQMAEVRRYRQQAANRLRTLEVEADTTRIERPLDVHAADETPPVEATATVPTPEPVKPTDVKSPITEPPARPTAGDAAGVDERLYDVVSGTDTVPANLTRTGLANTIDALEQKGISLLTPDDPRFPKRLNGIGRPYIFVAGDTSGLDEGVPTIAIIGSRKISQEGANIAYEAGELAAQRGITVVSGLAQGADEAGHAGALAGNGRTVGVIGNGINRKAYPTETEPLRQQMLDSGGAVISEFWPSFPGSGRRGNKDSSYVIRNATIVALSDYVFVAEAAEASGTTRAIREALSQGKTVFFLEGLARQAWIQKIIRSHPDQVRVVRSVDEVVKPRLGGAVTSGDAELDLPFEQTAKVNQPKPKTKEKEVDLWEGMEGVSTKRPAEAAPEPSRGTRGPGKQTRQQLEKQIHIARQRLERLPAKKGSYAPERYAKLVKEYKANLTRLEDLHQRRFGNQPAARPVEEVPEPPVEEVVEPVARAVEEPPVEEAPVPKVEETTIADEIEEIREPEQPVTQIVDEVVTPDEVTVKTQKRAVEIIREKLEDRLVGQFFVEDLSKELDGYTRFVDHELQKGAMTAEEAAASRATIAELKEMVEDARKRVQDRRKRPFYKPSQYFNSLNDLDAAFDFVNNTAELGMRSMSRELQDSATELYSSIERWRDQIDNSLLKYEKITEEEARALHNRINELHARLDARHDESLAVRQAWSEQVDEARSSLFEGRVIEDEAEISALSTKNKPRDDFVAALAYVKSQPEIKSDVFYLLDLRNRITDARNRIKSGAASGEEIEQVRVAADELEGLINDIMESNQTRGRQGRQQGEPDFVDYDDIPDEDLWAGFNDARKSPPEETKTVTKQPAKSVPVETVDETPPAQQSVRDILFSDKGARTARYEKEQTILDPYQITARRRTITHDLEQISKLEKQYTEQLLSLSSGVARTVQDTEPGWSKEISVHITWIRKKQNLQNAVEQNELDIILSAKLVDEDITVHQYDNIKRLYRETEKRIEEVIHDTYVKYAELADEDQYRLMERQIRQDFRNQVDELRAERDAKVEEVSESMRDLESISMKQLPSRPSEPSLPRTVRFRTQKPQEWGGKGKKKPKKRKEIPVTEKEDFVTYVTLSDEPIKDTIAKYVIAKRSEFGYDADELVDELSAAFDNIPDDSVFPRFGFGSKKLFLKYVQEALQFADETKDPTGLGFTHHRFRTVSAPENRVQVSENVEYSPGHYMFGPSADGAIVFSMHSSRPVYLHNYRTPAYETKHRLPYADFPDDTVYDEAARVLGDEFTAHFRANANSRYQMSNFEPARVYQIPHSQFFRKTDDRSRILGVGGTKRLAGRSVYIIGPRFSNQLAVTQERLLFSLEALRDKLLADGVKKIAIPTEAVEGLDGDEVVYAVVNAFRDTDIKVVVYGHNNPVALTDKRTWVYQKTVEGLPEQIVGSAVDESLSAIRYEIDAKGNIRTIFRRKPEKLEVGEIEISGRIGDPSTDEILETGLGITEETHTISAPEMVGLEGAVRRVDPDFDVQTDKEILDEIWDQAEQNAAAGRRRDNRGAAPDFDEENQTSMLAQSIWPGEYRIALIESGEAPVRTGRFNAAILEQWAEDSLTRLTTIEVGTHELAGVFNELVDNLSQYRAALIGGREGPGALFNQAEDVSAILQATASKIQDYRNRVPARGGTHAAPVAEEPQIDELEQLVSDLTTQFNQSRTQAAQYVDPVQPIVVQVDRLDELMSDAVFELLARGPGEDAVKALQEGEWGQRLEAIRAAREARSSLIGFYKAVGDLDNVETPLEEILGEAVNVLAQLSTPLRQVLQLDDMLVPSSVGIQSLNRRFEYAVHGLAEAFLTIGDEVADFSPEALEALRQGQEWLRGIAVGINSKSFNILERLVEAGKILETDGDDLFAGVGAIRAIRRELSKHDWFWQPRRGMQFIEQGVEHASSVYQFDYFLSKLEDVYAIADRYKALQKLWRPELTKGTITPRTLLVDTAPRGVSLLSERLQPFLKHTAVLGGKEEIADELVEIIRHVDYAVGKGEVPVARLRSFIELIERNTIDKWFLDDNIDLRIGEWLVAEGASDVALQRYVEQAGELGEAVGNLQRGLPVGPFSVEEYREAQVAYNKARRQAVLARTDTNLEELLREAISDAPAGATLRPLWKKTMPITPEEAVALQETLLDWRRLLGMDEYAATGYWNVISQAVGENVKHLLRTITPVTDPVPEFLPYLHMLKSLDATLDTTKDIMEMDPLVLHDLVIQTRALMAKFPEGEPIRVSHISQRPGVLLEESRRYDPETGAFLEDIAEVPLSDVLQQLHDAAVEALNTRATFTARKTAVNLFGEEPPVEKLEDVLSATYKQVEGIFFGDNPIDESQTYFRFQDPTRLTDEELAGGLGEAGLPAGFVTGKTEDVVERGSVETEVTDYTTLKYGSSLEGRVYEGSANWNDRYSVLYGHTMNDSGYSRNEAILSFRGARGETGRTKARAEWVKRGYGETIDNIRQMEEFRREIVQQVIELGNRFPTRQSFTAIKQNQKLVVSEWIARGYEDILNASDEDWAVIVQNEVRLWSQIVGESDESFARRMVRQLDGLDLHTPRPDGEMQNIYQQMIQQRIGIDDDFTEAAGVPFRSQVDEAAEAAEGTEKLAETTGGKKRRSRSSGRKSKLNALQKQIGDIEVALSKTYQPNSVVHQLLGTIVTLHKHVVDESLDSLPAQQITDMMNTLWVGALQPLSDELRLNQIHQLRNNLVHLFFNLVPKQEAALARVGQEATEIAETTEEIAAVSKRLVKRWQDVRTEIVDSENMDVGLLQRLDEHMEEVKAGTVPPDEWLIAQAQRTILPILQQKRATARFLEKPKIEQRILRAAQIVERFGEGIFTDTMSLSNIPTRLPAGVGDDVAGEVVEGVAPAVRESGEGRWEVGVQVGDDEVFKTFNNQPEIFEAAKQAKLDKQDQLNVYQIGENGERQLAYRIAAGDAVELPGRKTPIKRQLIPDLIEANDEVVGLRWVEEFTNQWSKEMGDVQEWLKIERKIAYDFEDTEELAQLAAQFNRQFSEHTTLIQFAVSRAEHAMKISDMQQLDAALRIVNDVMPDWLRLKHQIADEIPYVHPVNVRQDGEVLPTSRHTFHERYVQLWENTATAVGRLREIVSKYQASLHGSVAPGMRLGELSSLLGKVRSAATLADVKLLNGDQWLIQQQFVKHMDQVLSGKTQLDVRIVNRWVQMVDDVAWNHTVSWKKISSGGLGATEGSYAMVTRTGRSVNLDPYRRLQYHVQEFANYANNGSIVRTMGDQVEDVVPEGMKTPADTGEGYMWESGGGVGRGSRRSDSEEGGERVDDAEDWFAGQFSEPPDEVRGADEVVEAPPSEPPPPSQPSTPGGVDDPEGVLDSLKGLPVEEIVARLEADPALLKQVQDVLRNNPELFGEHRSIQIGNLRFDHPDYKPPRKQSSKPSGKQRRADGPDYETVSSADIYTWADLASGKYAPKAALVGQHLDKRAVEYLVNVIRRAAGRPTVREAPLDLNVVEYQPDLAAVDVAQMIRMRAAELYDLGYADDVIVPHVAEEFAAFRKHEGVNKNWFGRGMLIDVEDHEAIAGLWDAFFYGRELGEETLRTLSELKGAGLLQLDWLSDGERLYFLKSPEMLNEVPFTSLDDLQHPYTGTWYRIVTDADGKRVGRAVAYQSLQSAAKKGREVLQEGQTVSLHAGRVSTGDYGDPMYVVHPDRVERVRDWEPTPAERFEPTGGERLNRGANDLGEVVFNEAMDSLSSVGGPVTRGKLAGIGAEYVPTETSLRFRDEWALKHFVAGQQNVDPELVQELVKLIDEGGDFASLFDLRNADTMVFREKFEQFMSLIGKSDAELAEWGYWVQPGTRRFQFKARDVEVPAGTIRFRRVPGGQHGTKVALGVGDNRPVGFEVKVLKPGKKTPDETDEGFEAWAKKSKNVFHRNEEGVFILANASDESGVRYVFSGSAQKGIYLTRAQLENLSARVLTMEGLSETERIRLHGLLSGGNPNALFEDAAGVSYLRSLIPQEHDFISDGQRLITRDEDVLVDIGDAKVGGADDVEAARIEIENLKREVEDIKNAQPEIEEQAGNVKSMVGKRTEIAVESARLGVDPINFVITEFPRQTIRNILTDKLGIGKGITYAARALSGGSGWLDFWRRNLYARLKPAVPAGIRLVGSSGSYDLDLFLTAHGVAKAARQHYLEEFLRLAPDDRRTYMYQILEDLARWRSGDDVIARGMIRHFVEAQENITPVSLKGQPNMSRDANGTQAVMNWQTDSTFVLPNHTALKRVFSRYSSTKWLPKNILEGFTETTTSNRRKVAQALKAKADPNDELGYAAEDWWRLAYSATMDIETATGGAQNGLGLVSTALKVPGKILGHSTLLFSLMHLGLRAVSYSIRNFLDDQTRAFLLGRTNLFSDPLGWIDGMRASYAKRSLAPRIETLNGQIDNLVNDLPVGEALDTWIADKRLSVAFHEGMNEGQRRAAVAAAVRREVHNDPSVFAHQDVFKEIVESASDVGKRQRKLAKYGITDEFSQHDDLREAMAQTLIGNVVEELSTQGSSRHIKLGKWAEEHTELRRNARAWSHQLYRIMEDEDMRLVLGYLAGKYSKRSLINQYKRTNTFHEKQKALWSVAQHQSREQLTTADDMLEHMLTNVIIPHVEQMLEPIRLADPLNMARMYDHRQFTVPMDEAGNVKTVTWDPDGYENFVDDITEVRGMMETRRKAGAGQVVKDPGEIRTDWWATGPDQVPAVFDHRFGQRKAPQRNAVYRWFDKWLYYWGETTSQNLARQPAMYKVIQRRTGHYRSLFADTPQNKELASRLAYRDATRLSNRLFFNYRDLPSSLQTMNRVSPFFSAFAELFFAYGWRIPVELAGPGIGHAVMIRKIDRFFSALTNLGFVDKELVGDGSGLDDVSYRLRNPIGVLGQLFTLRAGLDQNADGSSLTGNTWSIKAGVPIDPFSGGGLGSAWQFTIGLNPLLSRPAAEVINKMPFVTSDQLIDSQSGETFDELFSRADVTSIGQFLTYNEETLRTLLGQEGFNRLLDGNYDITVPDNATFELPNTSLIGRMIEDLVFPFGKIQDLEGLGRAFTPRAIRLLADSHGLWRGKAFLPDVAAEAQHRSAIIQELGMGELMDGDLTKARELNAEAAKWDKVATEMGQAGARPTHKITSATILEVIDGDTIVVRWGDDETPHRIRIADISAAESRRQNIATGEWEPTGDLQAEQQTRWLRQQLMPNGVPARIDLEIHEQSDPETGELGFRTDQYGRFYANVIDAKGFSIANRAAAAGYAVSYEEATERAAEARERAERHEQNLVRKATERAAGGLLLRGVIGLFLPAVPAVETAIDQARSQFYQSSNWSESGKLRYENGDGRWRPMPTTDGPFSIADVAALVEGWGKDPNGGVSKSWLLKNYPELFGAATPTTFWTGIGKVPEIRDAEDFFRQREEGDRETIDPDVWALLVQESMIRADFQNNIVVQSGSNNPIYQVQYFLNNWETWVDALEQQAAERAGIEDLDEEVFGGKLRQFKARRSDRNASVESRVEERLLESIEATANILGQLDIQHLPEEEARAIRASVGDMEQRLNTILSAIQSDAIDRQSDFSKYMAQYFQVESIPYWERLAWFDDRIQEAESQPQRDSLWEARRRFQNEAYLRKPIVGGLEMPTEQERSWSGLTEEEQRWRVLQTVSGEPYRQTLHNVERVVEQYPQAEEYYPTTKEQLKSYYDREDSLSELSRRRVAEGWTDWQYSQMREKLENAWETHLNSSGREKELQLTKTRPIERFGLLGALSPELQLHRFEVTRILTALEREGQSLFGADASYLLDQLSAIILDEMKVKPHIREEYEAFGANIWSETQIDTILNYMFRGRG